MQPLSFGDIIAQGFRIGMKNALSLIGALFLWLVTFWIPYINVGTTIGLMGIIAKMGRGHVISPTEIFDPQYRKRMGEFFLVSIFLYMGATIGAIFMVIPGIIIGIAWGLAPLLVIDKNMNPMEAINRSNDLTYGKKWTIFGGLFILSLIVFVGAALLVGIFSQIAEALGALMFLVVYLCGAAVILGGKAYIYHTLTSEELPAESVPESGTPLFEKEPEAPQAPKPEE